MASYLVRIEHISGTILEIEVEANSFDEAKEKAKTNDDEVNCISSIKAYKRREAA